MLILKKDKACIMPHVMSTDDILTFSHTLTVVTETK